MADAPYLPHRHAAEPEALLGKLAWLQEHARAREADPRLSAWGQKHLSLGGSDLEAWCARAWWGVAAGELLRVYLYDRDKRDEALALLSEPDWTPIELALERGGAILAAAHLGPPKFLMNALIDRYDNALILTNTTDMPGWLPEIARHLLNPLEPSGGANVIAKAALHLREGGLVYGAPDGAFSQTQIYIEGFNRAWPFSPGIPAIARMIGVPCFTALALWEGNSIHLRIVPIETPAGQLPATAWHNAWIADHWSAIAPVIGGSPENLRFLTGRFRREMGT